MLGQLVSWPMCFSSLVPCLIFVDSWQALQIPSRARDLVPMEPLGTGSPTTDARCLLDGSRNTPNALRLSQSLHALVKLGIVPLFQMIRMVSGVPRFACGS